MADEEKNDGTPEEEATPEQPETEAEQGGADEGQAAQAEDAAPEDGGQTDGPAPAEEAALDEGAAVEEGTTGEPPAEDASADAGQPDDAPGDEAPAEEPSADQRRPEPARSAGAEKRGKRGDDEPEAIPGAHLEPDLVLEEDRGEGVGDVAGAEIEAAEQALAAEPPSATEPDETGDAEAAPVAREPLDLAADARYRATGKRKTAVARVILKPGDGTYTINGRALDQFFPRPTLQTLARSPLETAGYGTRMDVVAKIHGGGVSSQAGALRHGIARALVEADPNLRIELKRRGFLTRDARVKERKKAGLKKARKRPQFSKR